MAGSIIYAEIRRGKFRYYYVVRSARNGKVMSTSEKYWSKSNANRAAIKAGYLVRVTKQGSR